MTLGNGMEMFSAGPIKMQPSIVRPLKAHKIEEIRLVAKCKPKNYFS